MSARGPLTFRQRDVRAAIRSAMRRGQFGGLELSPDGGFSILKPNQMPPSGIGPLRVDLGPSVYFLEACPLTVIKIGHVSEGLTIFDRISGLQTGCPYRLTAIAVQSGLRQDEQYLHNFFAAERLAGEWFSISPRLASFIEFVRRGVAWRSAVWDISGDV